MGLLGGGGHVWLHLNLKLWLLHSDPLIVLPRVAKSEKGAILWLKRSCATQLRQRWSAGVSSVLLSHATWPQKLPRPRPPLTHTQLPTTLRPHNTHTQGHSHTWNWEQVDNGSSFKIFYVISLFALVTNFCQRSMLAQRIHLHLRLQLDPLRSIRTRVPNLPSPHPESGIPNPQSPIHASPNPVLRILANCLACDESEGLSTSSSNSISKSYE